MLRALKALCAVCMIAATLPLWATADPPARKAANGAVLPMPSIETLDCAEMRELLTVFTNSEYRGIATVPEEHPDRVIFDYEDRLAVRHFMECQAMGIHYRDTGKDFAPGFRQDRR